LGRFTDRKNTLYGARPVRVGKKGSWWTSFEELKTITEIPAPAQNFLSRE
jgi:hypothetical protein